MSNEIQGPVTPLGPAAVGANTGNDQPVAEHTELVLAAAVVPDEADVDEEEEQAAASKAVAPIIAAAVTRRI